MLYFIGLGLGDATDITVKGLEIVKKAKRVYLEAYTSILTVGKDALVSTKHAKTYTFFCKVVELGLKKKVVVLPTAPGPKFVKIGPGFF